MAQSYETVPLQADELLSQQVDTPPIYAIDYSQPLGDDEFDWRSRTEPDTAVFAAARVNQPPNPRPFVVAPRPVRFTRLRAVSINRRQMLIGCGVLAAAAAACLCCGGAVEVVRLFQEKFEQQQPTGAPSPDIRLSPDRQEAAWRMFQAEYATWKNQYVIDGKNGKQRVLYDPESNNSAAEVQAYGLLFAVNMGDKDTYDKLWRYIQQYKNAHGTISWLINANGSVADPSSIFDSTQDIAASLLAADRKWPGNGYAQQASELLQGSLNYEVEHPTAIPKGGDWGGGSSLTNPSYYDPYDYQVTFSAINPGWQDVLQATQREMDVIGAKIDAGALASFPDWANISGDPVGGPDGSPPQIGYESTRIPQRQLRAALGLTGDSRENAIKQLKRYNKFYEGIVAGSNGKFDINRIVDGYSTSGRQTSFDPVTAFSSAAVVASVVSDNPGYTDYMFSQLPKLKTSYPFNYYMWLNVLLALSGKNI